MSDDSFITHATRTTRLVEEMPDVFGPPMAYMQKLSNSLRETGNEDGAVQVKAELERLLDWLQNMGECIELLADDYRMEAK